jgi:transcriptional accessory protein Tex/SPT6
LGVIYDVFNLQILAINRAEGEKILAVKLNCPQNLENKFLHEAEKQRIIRINRGSGKVKPHKMNDFSSDVISLYVGLISTIFSLQRFFEG